MPGVVPVVEDSVAAADRGRLAAERCPGQADARHQVQLVADARLQLVADADAERQIAVNSELIGPVDARLILAERGIESAQAL